MASILAKRRRADPETSRKVRVISKGGAPARKSDAESDDEDGQEVLDAQEIFRRHFEAQFKPLPEVRLREKKVDVQESEEEDEEEDWDGISGDGEGEDGGSDEDEDEDMAPTVDVVEHTATITRPKMSKAELKAFMSSKPPTALPTSTSTGKPKPADPSDVSEAANLKNDLALQRLLSESHLLSSSSGSHEPSGTNRHKATDLRVQRLGAKRSILVQEKMPLSHRRGMMKKAAVREETRRSEARENGIVLERVRGKGGEAKGKRRERGVGAPAVGRFRGGTLRLSRRDVEEIEGPKRGGKGGKGGRGRGGRGGKR